MPVIASLSTAVPPHKISREQSKALTSNLFQESFRDVERILSVFDHAQIDERHFCVPPEWFLEPHAFSEKNALYADWAVRLGSEAAESAIRKSGLLPRDIDSIAFVSSTGIATPSLDSVIAERIGLRRDVRRVPLWGLGCAGGAAGLARAADFTRADPDSAVLLIAVELCGLTFVRGDRSKSNLVGAALFADGAAAAVIAGNRLAGRMAPEGPAPTVVGSSSYLWPDRSDIMGWNVADDGLRVVFSRDIPSLVEREIAGQVDALLRENGLSRGDLSHFVAHPGGKKVIDAYRAALDLPEDWMSPTREVLRRFGNMSSPTVLFTLHHLMRGDPSPGYAALVALGPGFSCEQVLIRF